MKAKLTTLPQAAFRLLVTFGFNPAALARILTIGLASLVAAPCEAAPPSGGGGANGGGTIYYVGPSPGTTTSVMTRMNADGSGKTTLAGGIFGNPSFVLFNSHRWFITTWVISGQFYPDGFPRREVFALRDDYHSSLNNNANTKVQLTNDPTLQPGYTDWVPGGAQISFRGRRFPSNEPGAIVDEGGIYVASLVFDADGNIAGLAEQPAAPAIPFPIVETAHDGLWPDLANYFSWNPAGNVVVHTNVAGNELWLADMLDVHIRIFVAGTYQGMAGGPQWSPDGSVIAFGRGGSIATIKPDGTGFTVIIPGPTTWIYSGPHFSPTGSHIVYEGFNKTTGNSDLFRATAKGAKPVNLTNTPLSESPWLGIGWR